MAIVKRSFLQILAWILSSSAWTATDCTLPNACEEQPDGACIASCDYTEVRQGCYQSSLCTRTGLWCDSSGIYSGQCSSTPCNGSDDNYTSGVICDINSVTYYKYRFDRCNSGAYKIGAYSFGSINTSNVFINQCTNCPVSPFSGGVLSSTTGTEVADCYITGSYTDAIGSFGYASNKCNYTL